MGPPMTLIEAGALLGVTAATLRQQIANGKLRAKKIGRDWSVSIEEVERYRRESRRLVALSPSAPNASSASEG